MPTMRISLLSAILVTATAGSVAIASPPSNFTGTSLVAGDLNEVTNLSSEGIKFQTSSVTDGSVVKLEWQPGGTSGWHHHPGVLTVMVASGSVLVTRAQNGHCVSKSYGPGSPNGSIFTEDDTMHVGTSDHGAVAYATAIVKDATPKVFRIEDSVPSCASGPHAVTPRS